ncbi:MAG: DUF1080 domain-containing protein [Rikenellaceae bacterium]
MKKLTLLTLLFALTCLTISAKDYPDSKFKTIFNGKNFDGWYLKIRSGDDALAKRVFAIENQEVHVYDDSFPQEYELEEPANNTHGMMYTNKKYSRYIFRFDYKWGTKISNNFSKLQYDAGFYYHVTDDKIWPKGIEYQIRYDHTKKQNHTGDYYITRSQNPTWFSDGKNSFLLPKDGGVPTPRRRGLLIAAKSAPHSGLEGKWESCEIIVMGDKYSIHKLNGEIVNMTTELGVSEGVIGLQSETAEIYYRNVRILEFDEDVPMEVFLK